MSVMALATPISPILAGFLGSLAAGLMTAVGAIPLFVLKSISQKTQRSLLGFAAGVMLAASFFSLIIPGIDALQESGFSKAAAAAGVAVAVLAGAAAIGALNRYAALDIGAVGRADEDPRRARRLSLFLIAITLHNFPEGMAVGVSFGGALDAGVSTAIGIGLQNLPEGLATATALVALGYGRWLGFLGAVMSGLVEPIGGLIGVSAVTLAPALLPAGLGLAAGAMIYVVTAQIIPEAQSSQSGRDDGAMIGLMIGLVGMMFLDIALG